VISFKTREWGRKNSNSGSRKKGKERYHPRTSGVKPYLGGHEVSGKMTLINTKRKDIHAWQVKGTVVRTKGNGSRVRAQRENVKEKLSESQPN